MRREDPCSSLDGDGDDSEDQHDQDTADLMMDPSPPYQWPGQCLYPVLVLVTQPAYLPQN